jgi:hypothetical protein
MGEGEAPGRSPSYVLETMRPPIGATALPRDLVRRQIFRTALKALATAADSARRNPTPEQEPSTRGFEPRPRLSACSYMVARPILCQI